MKQIEASHHNATLVVDAPQSRHAEVARRLVAALVEAGVADGLPYIGPMEEPAT